jgi:hypothetical protein
MMLGREKPDEGSFTVGETVEIAVVDQGREGLEPSNSVYEEITGGADFLELGTTEVNSRAYCSWFGFKGGDQQKKVLPGTTQSYIIFIYHQEFHYSRRVCFCSFPYFPLDFPLALSSFALCPPSYARASTTNLTCHLTFNI